MKSSVLTKGCLIRALIALLLAVSMMVGTTFAWFTDKESTGTNKIVAGNLDVGLEVKEADGYVDAADKTLFDEDFLWEPGAMLESTMFRVVNKGSLALKYKLTLNVLEEKKTADGHSLLDVIKMGVLTEKAVSELSESLGDSATAYEKREAYKAAVEKNGGFMAFNEFKNVGTLDASTQSSGLVIVLYWEPAETDNLYNGKEAEITFSLNVMAAQTPHESDSFGDDYDSTATYTGKNGIDSEMSAEQLNDVLKETLADTSASNVVYGTYAEHKEDVDSTWEEGTPVDDAGLIRSFYVDDTSTLYILNEHKGEKITVPEDATGLFEDLDGVTSIDLSGLDFSGVTNASHMFNDLDDLVSVDFTGVDFSSVKTADHMFMWCSNLESVSFEDVNFSSVEDVSSMFVYCLGLEEVNLSGIDFSNVTEISNMFQTCHALRTVDFGDADLSKVTSFAQLFGDCKALESVDMSGVKTSSKLTSMNSMFVNCSALTSVKFGDGLDTSGVNNFYTMFSKCSALETLDLSAFDSHPDTTINITNMFSGCSSLKTIYATEAFDLSDVKTPANIFNECVNLAGDKGTTFSKSGSGPMSTRAHLDGGDSDPGYFSAKAD